MGGCRWPWRLHRRVRPAFHQQSLPGETGPGQGPCPAAPEAHVRDHFDHFDHLYNPKEEGKRFDVRMETGVRGESRNDRTPKEVIEVINVITSSHGGGRIRAYS